MKLDNQYLKQYEDNLKNLLLEKCSSNGFLDRVLLEVEELDEMWSYFAPEYMADAVPIVNDYPTVAMAWASYFGMGLSALWDGSWSDYAGRKDLYSAIRDERGFDNMDEYILEDLLGIDLISEENNKLEEMLRSLAQSSVSQIRREQIEAGTSEAFYIFASTAKIMFKIGVAIELKRLGYRYEKATINEAKEIVN